MGHYSNGQKPDDLWPKAQEAADKLLRIYAGTKERPLLCYRGMSGTASATALSLALHIKSPDFAFGMCYVRKPEEKAHGDSMTVVEPTYAWSQDLTLVPTFVDDFICGGETMRKTMQAVADRDQGIGLPVKFKDDAKAVLLQTNWAGEELLHNLNVYATYRSIVEAQNGPA